MRYLLVILFLLPQLSRSMDIQARFDHAVFYAPEIGHFMETYINVVGHTVKYKPNDNGILQSKVEMTVILKRDDKIIDFQKEIVSGPEIPDSVAIDFKHLQRFSLEPGAYQVEIVLNDMNKPNSEAVSFIKDVEVEDWKKGLQISDIELLESITKTKEKNTLSKAGYDLVPLVDNFFPVELNKIAFYAEVYNSPKVIGHDDRFLVKVQVRNYDNMQIMSGFGSVKKFDTETVVPMIHIVDIDALPSGNYELMVSVINRSNELVTRRNIYFQRLNPVANLNTENLEDVEIQSTFVNLIENEDTLDYYIASLRPITSPLEKRIMDESMENYDLETKKKFFFTFWQNRSPENPEDGWNKYKEKIDLVNKMFSTKIRHGFETDRGRVYLKYGEPDYVEARPNEPSSYPYVMWQYYKIKEFNNRMFIFYQPDLVTNDYVLLHSDMQGEVQNYRWRTELEKRNTPFQSIDAQSGVNHYGGRSEEVFERSK